MSDKNLDSAGLAAMTIAQIERWVAAVADEDGPWRALLEQDRRQGVRQLAVRHARRLQRARAERARLEGMLQHEQRLWARGARHIAGVDEAGRGCLAGPVVAAAVVLAPGTLIEGLNDSKKLKPETRQQFYDEIRRRAVAVGVGAVDAAEIDRLNILRAALKAMRLALEDLGASPDQVLVDGNQLPRSPFPETAMVEGDARSLSIAAASVIAKVHRDRLMVQWDGDFPGYGFGRHKGYGSAEHLEALRRLGPCPLHRRSFGPVADLVAAPSEAFETFKEGIASCRGLGELERLGGYIRQGSDLLKPKEVEQLRRLYRRRQQFLDGDGPRGEAAAAAFLKDLGYRLLEHNYRGGGGEIDLVAKDGDCLVFVEVKSRQGAGRPEERIDGRKRGRLGRAAQHYLAQSAAAGLARFDVVAVEWIGGEARVQHFIDAFQV